MSARNQGEMGLQGGHSPGVPFGATLANPSDRMNRVLAPSFESRATGNRLTSMVWKVLLAAASLGPYAGAVAGRQILEVL